MRIISLLGLKSSNQQKLFTFDLRAQVRLSLINSLFFRVWVHLGTSKLKLKFSVTNRWTTSRTAIIITASSSNTLEWHCDVRVLRIHVYTLVKKQISVIFMLFFLYKIHVQLSFWTLMYCNFIYKFNFNFITVLSFTCILFYKFNSNFITLFIICFL